MTSNPHNPVFGPDFDKNLDEAKLFALPANCMAAACMASHFRRLSGWLGLALAPSAGQKKAFTCRVKNRAGVFGLLPLWAAPGDPKKEKPVSIVDFRLFYFPSMKEDPMLDAVSLSAALGMANPQALEFVRDFPAYPDFAANFVLADMRIALTHPGHGLAMSLTAPTHRRVIFEEGIKIETGAYVVPKGGFEENLPAFELAHDLFLVLAAGFAAVEKEVPGAWRVSKQPYAVKRHKKEGVIEDWESPDIYMRSDILLWEPGLSTVWDGAETDASISQDYRLLSVAAGKKAPNQEEVNQMTLPRLVVLCGFLGAGKTSFLNQFIEFHLSHDRQVAVLQNEVGEQGVDESLLEGDESVLAIDSGCVCCTMAGSLTRGLRQITETMSPEVIVLETTGLANPLNMIDEFQELSDLALLSAVVTVVDAARFWQSLDTSDIPSRQIKAADTIVVNKCDLVDQSALGKIKKEIGKINPGANVIEAINGRVNPGVLGEELSRHIKEEPPVPGTVCCSHHHHHVHDHHNHGHHPKHDENITHLEEGFMAVKFDVAPQISHDALMAVLSKLPQNVVRVKGVVLLTEMARPQVVQYVPGQMACEPAVRRTHDTPFILVIGQQLDLNLLGVLFSPLFDTHCEHRSTSV
nr:CobW family GTP-binding protein [uncultured Desulfobacter sp.]